MGRAPCCDKANVKKGPWSPEEDTKLKAYIENHGTGGNWIALPQKIAQLPGRTDNDIKNYWNTRLKKKLLGKQRKEQQARRASCATAKQEMKMERGNFVASEAMNLDPLWTELPVAMAMPVLNPNLNSNPNQEPYLKDQESIRTLLIKLGGNFYGDHHQSNTTTTITNFQYPSNNFSFQDQLYGNFINMSSSFSQLPNTQYIINGEVPNMIRETNFPIELDDMVYCKQQFDGFESFSRGDMVNSSIGNSSVESTSWEDICSLVYTPMVSGSEICRQEMPQNCLDGEPRYLGLQ
ncbi:unnamed protein product [Ilex paraguariensis]|uniref:Uncharacterized protein n=1 Tax=Ilex paraguariensis TaxID=185542 RepID=A0ABC8UI57_9AQUA